MRSPTPGPPTAARSSTCTGTGARPTWSSAETASRKALELGPELAEAHASRGLALSLSKRYDEAEREFATALRLNPKHFEAHYFFGRALFQQGRYAEAVAHYEEASRIRPEDYQTALLVVPSLRSLGRVAEAEATQRRGVQVAERHARAQPGRRTGTLSRAPVR